MSEVPGGTDGLWTALREGRLEEALAEAERLLAIDPGDPDVVRVRATALGQAGRAEEALGAWQRLAELLPDAGFPHYEQGVVLQELGRDEEALAAYEQATELDPRDAAGWVNQGRLLDEEGRCDEAVRCYRRALRLEPDDPEVVLIAWSNLGNSYLHLWRFEDALEAFDRALALDGESVPARLGRASALAGLGRAAEATAAGPRGTPYDRGELRERRAPAGERDLVVRYWIGQHSAPHLLDAEAEAMLERCVPLKDQGAGLADGVRIRYGWSCLTVRELVGDLVLCEPEFLRDPFEELSPEVSFTLQAAVMTEILHVQTGAPIEACTFDEAVAVVEGALTAPEVLAMRQAASDDRGLSGWVIGPTDPAALERALEEDRIDLLPSAALAAIRPHLLKVLTLPAGWSARFEDHAVVSIVDPHGAERWKGER